MSSSLSLIAVSSLVSTGKRPTPIRDRWQSLGWTEATRPRLFWGGSDETLAEPVSAEGRGGRCGMDVGDGFISKRLVRALETMSIKGDGMGGVRASLELELTASLLAFLFQLGFFSHPSFHSHRGIHLCKVSLPSPFIVIYDRIALSCSILVFIR